MHRNYPPVSYNDKKKLLFIGPLGVVLILVAVATLGLLGTIISGALLVLGIWFILEGFEWPRKRKTLLLDLLSGNFRPLVAILVGGFIVGFFSEQANILAPTQQWIYYGVPWQNIAFLDVPVFILLTWSVMYIIFLSLENILLRQEVVIWD